MGLICLTLLPGSPRQKSVQTERELFHILFHLQIDEKDKFCPRQIVEIFLVRSIENFQVKKALLKLAVPSTQLEEYYQHLLQYN
ncbi:MAG: hypothetical protein ACD_34C00565G0001 [uncultured bacterium]|nr:MAG: hypothetical protein ACD_34C00565G0001 [uncultured bacterium]